MDEWVNKLTNEHMNEIIIDNNVGFEVDSGGSAMSRQPHYRDRDSHSHKTHTCTAATADDFLSSHLSSNDAAVFHDHLATTT